MDRNRAYSKVEPMPIAMPARLANASVGRRWKFRRDLIIFLASRHGASQRLIADVFDLPHSRVHQIIKRMRVEYGGPGERAQYHGRVVE